MNKPSIHLETIILGLIPVLIACLTFGYYFIQTHFEESDIQLQMRAETTAKMLAPATEYGVVSGNTEFLSDLLEEALKGNDLISITIVDIEDNTVISRINHAVVVVDPISYKHPIFLKGINISDTVDDIFDTNNDEQLGWIFVRMSGFENAAKKSNVIARIVIFLIAVITISLALLISLSRRLSNPIVKMTKAIEKISNNKYDIEVGRYSNRDLDYLANGISSMARSIGSLITNQQREIEAATNELTDSINKIEIQNRELETERLKAVKANEVKGEFLANMSHELRTPLNGITGFCDVLANTQLSFEQQEAMAAIQVSSRTLMQIINDILDFSKIDAGMLDIDQQTIDINECIEEVMVLLSPYAHNKSINLYYSNTDISSRFIRSDRLRIKQILTNLVNNAIKFTENGYVKVNIVNNKNSNNLLIEVVDTGIGLSYDFQRKMFNEFTQEDCSITRNYGGTGLGLAVSKKLIDLLGGEIGVNSSPGHGTRFWFTLPKGVVVDADNKNLDANIYFDREVLFLHDKVNGDDVLIAPIEERGACVVVRSIDSFYTEDPTGFDLIVVRSSSTEIERLDLAQYISEFLAHIPVLIITDNPDFIDFDNRLDLSNVTLRKEYVTLAAGLTLISRLFDKDFVEPSTHNEVITTRLERPGSRYFCESLFWASKPKQTAKLHATVYACGARRPAYVA
ncbi:ATP-binding protein [Candidatus Reidiella endopervernicosa]|uniref:histidine kinase n=1 Tax=Candidatus Reidiella endopervernicosa TaxID=2738883 RepID=A0A6N0HXE1_9GAMM|nr:ATP-binding protein [Candidatus Reidiella endopervernicosa]QKQ27023.1 hypothetical protein HUE57_12605 [Candidatus Reidiella endopervernicosa]